MGKSRTAPPRSRQPAYADLPYALVMIEWVDASRLSNSWMGLSAVPEPYLHRCVTVGFLVAENERGKIIVPTVTNLEYDDNKQTYGGMMIPASAVISQRTLR
jgi:hypothetical protein